MSKIVRIYDCASPKWKAIYDLFAEQEAGYTLLFDQIIDATRFRRKTITSLIPLVNEHLAVNERKTLVNVRKIGYKIASSSEALHEVAKSLQRIKRKAKEIEVLRNICIEK